MGKRIDYEKSVIWTIVELGCLLKLADKRWQLKLFFYNLI